MKKKLTNEEFLDALTHLLLTGGIKGLTVGEIATRMHCSRRRLYDIAQTKEEIFCVVVQRFFDSILEQGEALIRSEKDLTTALAAYLSVGVHAASRIGVQFLKDVEDSAVARGIFDRYQHARTLRMSQLIDEGVRQHVFTPCHGLVMSEVMLGAALRLRRPAFLAEANLTIEDAFQEFYRVLLSGLLTDSAATHPAKIGKRAVRAVRAGVRRGAAKKDADQDEVDSMLMAAWNRE